jgi:retron-type reverse transcriptase
VELVEFQKKIQFQEKDLVKLHKDLKTHRYRLDHSKRVAMPKPDGGTRYLGIKKYIKRFSNLSV